VEDDPPPPNRWEATATTALHNVIDYPGRYEFFAVSKMIFANPTTSIIDWTFDDYRRSLTSTDRIVLVPADQNFAALEWRSYDVARARVADDPKHLLTQKHLSFERIPDIWDDITVGVKIGIVVFRNFDINASDTGASISEATLKKLFGEKDSVCVLRVRSPNCTTTAQDPLSILSTHIEDVREQLSSCWTRASQPRTLRVIKERL
jgi:hypothetical protein